MKNIHHIQHIQHAAPSSRRRGAPTPPSCAKHCGVRGRGVGVRGGFRVLALGVSARGAHPPRPPPPHHGVLGKMTRRRCQTLRPLGARQCVVASCSWRASVLHRAVGRACSARVGRLERMATTGPPTDNMTTRPPHWCARAGACRTLLTTVQVSVEGCRDGAASSPPAASAGARVRAPSCFLANR